MENRINIKINEIISSGKISHKRNEFLSNESQVKKQKYDSSINRSGDISLTKRQIDERKQLNDTYEEMQSKKKLLEEERAELEAILNEKRVFWDERSIGNDSLITDYRNMTKELSKLPQIQATRISVLQNDFKSEKHVLCKQYKDKTEALRLKYEHILNKMDYEGKIKLENQLNMSHNNIKNVEKEIKAIALKYKDDLETINLQFNAWKNDFNNNFHELLDDNIKKKDTIENLQKDISEICRAKINTRAVHLQESLQNLEQVTCNLKEATLKYPNIQDHIDNLQNSIKNESILIDSYKDKIIRQQNLIPLHKADAIEQDTVRLVLHNQLQDLRGNFRVYCRVRPPLKGIEPLDTSHILINAFNAELGSQSIEVEKNCNLTPIKYSFDKVFSQTDTNQEIFKEVSELIQSSLDGFNVCIFAYGQTGSGKTFTMLNPKDGIIPSTAKHIFDWIDNSAKNGWKYNVTCEFLEIYNDEIYDLLRSDDNKSNSSNGPRHKIHHDDASKTTVVENLETITLTSKESVDAVLKNAMKLRATASTSSNERSSRSHSIFIIKIHGINEGLGEERNGLLNLIDLAGSERLSVSKVQSERIKETQHINKSLSFLGNVMNSLGSPDATTRHISFRDSKLTYLLQYSLTGNSKTLMVVNISSSSDHINETIKSLNFAKKVNSTKIIKRKS
ncbi:hypothetical protein TBLA_0C05310 [Henningerozyma blattae CBS 6284]|uniref:Kinesin motor domain-containing protein n=1 Tax=Henningerozyma blattae (strain ATCC 34711 / CBS 6284 / DSM 70876 / NBRC 10599 / NRRL Y-10934 / UCD 77-7) TaxID=1071380 RepID=I2H1S5_HENB6|nr:hypothetical protein TBLA_0C05310 [Tetrapisispora blattae CBS 6284]CCH60327.1 hypothetical protein TBLA_0C05310 [Tetrapisispora blattae CBS 6284]